MGFATVFNQPYAIDPGSSRVSLATEGGGRIVREPCLISLVVRRPVPARGRRPNPPAEDLRLLAVGSAVKPPLPGGEDAVRFVRPVERGRVVDSHSLGLVLRRVFGQARLGYLRKTVLGLRMALLQPLHLDAREQAAFREQLRDFGINRIHVIEAPLAAAVGAGLAPERSLGQMLIDIGAGQTTVVTLTLGSIATWHWAPIGGRDLDEAIVAHVQRRHRIRLLPAVAEAIKLQLGSVYPRTRPETLDIVGIDTATGVEKKVTLDDNDLRDVLIDGCEPLILAIHQSFEGVPPELAADIAQGEITLVGGGALLAGLADFLADRTGLRYRVAVDPIDAAVRGAFLIA